MHKWHERMTALLIGYLLSGLAIGQDSSISIPTDSKFVLRVDLTAIKQTKLGAMLLSLAKQKALEEFGKEGGDEAGITRIKGMLGFDPFEEVQAITLSSSEYDEPEKSLLAIVQLNKTAGNLEGMALGGANHRGYCDCKCLRFIAGCRFK